MTISEIAAQMGVTKETLVQEVIAQGTVKATACVILGVLAIVLAVAVLFIGAYQGSEFGIPLTMLLVLIGIGLLLLATDLINWKTAPETTANQYIVEHYGGVQNDD